MDLTATKRSGSVQWRAHQNSSGQLHHTVEGVRLCTHWENFVRGVCCAPGSRLSFDRCLLAGICPPPESSESHRGSSESGFKTIWEKFPPPPWMCREKKKSQFLKNLNKWKLLPPWLRRSQILLHLQETLNNGCSSTEQNVNILLCFFMIYLLIHWYLHLELANNSHICLFFGCLGNIIFFTLFCF